MVNVRAYVMRLILPLIALLSTATPALAQEGCGPLDQLRAKLAAEYQEQEVRQGVSDRGWLMRLFMAPTGATWTIVGEKPGTGVGCVLDSGSDLREPPLPTPDQGEGL
jgi:hypothetical protein